MRVLIFALASMLAVLRGVSAETIIVSAAASLTDVLGELGRSYEASHSGDQVNFNFGASNLLARQIEEGAPVDAFVSADEASVDRLEKRGLLVEGSRRSLLSNVLVIAVARDSRIPIEFPLALASASVGSIALAEPSAVPAGIYARKYLQKIGLWEAVKGKVIPTENVRGALAAVETGNADAAIVYRTDARASKRVRVAFEVSEADGPVISYGAAAVRGSAHAAAAKTFLEFLESPAAADVFRRGGFLPRTRKN